MISGECRVEPIGLPSGHQLALEGLRLRLDLRIVPGTVGDGSAAAVWRVEDGRVSTLPLGIPALYRRGAMLTGLGVLAVALVVWWGAAHTPSDAPPGAENGAATSGAVSASGSAQTIITTITHGAAGGPVAGSAGDAPKWPGAEHDGNNPRVAPLISSPAVASAPPLEPVPPEPVPPEAMPNAPVAAAPPARPAQSASRALRPVSPGPRPPPPAAAPSHGGSRDMLELFNEMK